MIKVKTKEEIEIMRESGQILARTLDLLKNEIRPGISTKHLDKIANEYIISCGGKPAFLKLYGIFFLPKIKLQLHSKLQFEF